MATDKKPLPQDPSEDLPEEIMEEAVYSTISLGDPELEAQFLMLRKAHDELEDRLIDVFNKMGFTKHSFTQYLNNPKNFNSQDWTNLQKGRSDVQKKIVKMFGAEAQRQIEKAEKEKVSQVRKGKTLGARKKWMPMR